MNYSFVCRLICNGKFKGTAFFIRKNIVITAAHNFKDIDLSTAALCIKFESPNIQELEVESVINVSDLDFVQLILKRNVSYDEFPEISVEDIDAADALTTFGYPNDHQSFIKLDYYTELTGEAADHSLMVNYEEEGARWNGISGAPLICDGYINGIVIKNNGGDGLKTRLKIVSFNKIINYLVDNDLKEALENIPQKFTTSQLYQRMINNKELCDKLYYSTKYKSDETNLDMNLHFLRINERKRVDMYGFNSYIQDAIGSYSLMLDDLYSNKQVDKYDEKIKRFIYTSERIAKVKARMNIKENIGLIMLWILSEGILLIPRIGRFLVEREGTLFEEDLYFKRSEERVTLVIPFVSIYEDLFESIENILKSINKSISSETDLVDYDSIEWDGNAVSCLDYRSQVMINKVLSGNKEQKVNVEITSLIIYSTDMYGNIPEVIDNDSRAIKFFEQKFFGDFRKDIGGYLKMIPKYEFIDRIKLNLFIVPISTISDLDTIYEESR
ncbi:hypothetical protein [Clostridium sp. C8]|uniref:hypothetical protein n=1 Tax=Clostridium sp. C8 TaxID=1667357 RepID=UPI00062E5D8D|nr:hypothetical protein [Clostridium sp. C8]KLE15325.1 hypothetical protein AAT22_12490 [Clostridium sp. C8]MDU1566156.1 hypothetical protein [Clostridium sp.]